MDIRPVELPSLRTELLNPDGFMHEKDVFEALAQDYNLSGDMVNKMVPAVAAQRRALRAADLFFVAPEMARLAAAAASALPDFAATHEDLPTPHGFVMFGEQLDCPAASELLPAAPVHGAVWSTDSDHLSVWHVLDSAWLSATLTRELTGSSRRSVARFQVLPSCISMPLQHDPITAGFDGFGTPIELNETSLHLLRFLKAVWLLMAQPIGQVEDAHFDRASRRRLKREGREPEPVRVITLRRPAGISSGSEGDREYHHQWIVRGHWRQQWYPARQVHRPVWIAPHIKGPEGAPLLGGEKVYALRR